MLVDDIIDRLKVAIPALGGRVETAAALAALMSKGGMPGQTPVAYVIPTGMSGGQETSLTGMYRQDIDRLVSVILAVRTHDKTGARALEDLEGLLQAITEALAGWVPAGFQHGLRFRRTQSISSAAGAFVYEFTFTLTDELRTAR